MRSTLSAAMYTVAALTALLLLPRAGLTQDAQTNGRPRRVAVARFISEKITVDGVPDEPVWQSAEPTAGFLQQDPVVGVPVSETTEVRILYDKENLYFGVICHDRTPETMIINDINRDFNSGSEDFFSVYLDTFHDRSNGYYFATTPAGGQRDMQFSDEGRVSNFNWDGVWFAEARRNEEGWTAEFAIPFKTLRFSNARQQIWGLNMNRRIRRRQEISYWSLPPRRYSQARNIPFAGDLVGIEDVEPGRNLHVKPYVLGGVKRVASLGKDREGDFDAGVDLKYGITSGLTLDLTGNTDFSEVEADTQVVNLTRFSTFFPEKREFFLENSGLFQFGTLTRSEGLLFQSRTIGLKNGQPIPILGGARLTGHTGRNYVGLLNMQTRSEAATPATNFTVARFKRDILGNSNMGFMFLNRQSRLPDDYNRSFGADTNLLFFGTDLRIGAALGRTVTPGLTGDDKVGKIETEVQNDLVRFFGSYAHVGEDANPEMGFVQRTGRRFAHGDLTLRPRFDPETRLGKVLLDVTATMNADQVLFTTGGTEEKSLRPTLTVLFRDGGNVTAEFTNTFERIEEAFRVSGVRISAGDFRSNKFGLSYSSNASRKLSGGAGFVQGDYYAGTLTEWSADAQYHFGYRLTAAFTYSRDQAELPQAAFTTHLTTLRLNYSFNPKMFLHSLIQYNSQNNQVSTNVRFRLIHRPLSDIFIVYNDLRDRAKSTNDRGLSLKYTHLLNF